MYNTKQICLSLGDLKYKEIWNFIHNSRSGFFNWPLMPFMTHEKIVEWAYDLEKIVDYYACLLWPY